MLRIASNALIVPPFECAWLSLVDYGQVDGACCIQFDCKGESDVTIILKPFPGAKRWQHYQRQQGPAGAELAVEDNYTVILGSHRNSKLKIEKNGDEKATASGLPGCTVNTGVFRTCWINYAEGTISIGTGAAGSCMIFQWEDPEPAVSNIQHVGLSCWDTHVSYRNVQVLPPLGTGQLDKLHQQLQLLSKPQHDHQHPCQPPHQPCVPSLVELVMDSVISNLQPASVCQALHLSELLLPRTQRLYDAAVQLAGKWFQHLVHQHLDEFAGLSPEELTDILQEPLLEVSELLIFQAVAAWCQLGAEQAPCSPHMQPGSASSPTGLVLKSSVCSSAEANRLQRNCGNGQSKLGVERPPSQVLGALQLVRFALMTNAEQRAVLDHPFSVQCSLVQHCLQEDLQRLRDSISGSSPQGQYTCEQRRLVRPAAAGQATERSAFAPAAMPAKDTCSMPLGVAGQTADMAGAAGATITCPEMSSERVAGRSSTCSLLPAASMPSPIPGGSTSGLVVDPSKAAGWLRYRRRLAPSCKELMYVYDGDRNGVLHHIATEYGSKQWVNPVLSKAVEIKASSPPSRYTDPKAIVSGQFLNTSYAGPRYIRGCPAPAGDVAAAARTCSGSSSTMPSTWWQLDLGPQHRLLCNYYTIRHDGSHDGFVRSWVLQGSNDLQHWLDLRLHQNDGTLRLPGQYGSWPVMGPAAAVPFRAFRLLMLGPSNSPTSPWAFCLSYWELYGYFYKLSDDHQSLGPAHGVLGHQGAVGRANTVDADGT